MLVGNLDELAIEIPRDHGARESADLSGEASWLAHGHRLLVTARGKWFDRCFFYSKWKRNGGKVGIAGVPKKNVDSLKSYMLHFFQK